MPADTDLDSWESIFGDLCELVENLPAPPKRLRNEMTPTDRNLILAVPVAWGWLIRVMRTSQAIIRLVGIGFDAETSPLRRSVLEHSIRLHWASAVDPDMWIELVHKEHGRTFEKFRNASQDGLTLSEEQLEWVLRQEELSSERFQESSNLTSMTNIFLSNRDLYGVQRQAWYLDTKESHPTLSSASPYSEESEEGSTVHLLTSPKSSHLRNADSDLAVYMYTALLSYASIVGLVEQTSEQLSSINARMLRLSRLGV